MLTLDQMHLEIPITNSCISSEFSTNPPVARYVIKIITCLGVGLILTLMSVAHAAESIPTPTKLEAALAQPGAVVETEIELGQVSSSGVEFAVYEVTVKAASGEVLNGIKIHLTNPSGSEDVFLESERVPLLLKELQEIENCKLYYSCEGYFGIARCRPSQPEPQAYCLENFNISETDFGTLFRTPTGWFKLNQVSPNALIDVVSRYGSSKNDGS